MKKSYYTSCVNAKADDIYDMLDHAKEITYRTLLKHVGAKELQTVFSDYDWGPKKQWGLRLKDDWAVSFRKSVYRGRACVFVCHSAIEYIFV